MTAPMEANFNTRDSCGATHATKLSLDKLNASKKKRHLSIDDVKYDTGLAELVDVAAQVDAELSETRVAPTREFHVCPLCSHCLVEPVTLVCGCSFCKRCLKEIEGQSAFKFKQDNAATTSASQTWVNQVFFRFAFFFLNRELPVRFCIVSQPPNDGSDHTNYILKCIYLCTTPWRLHAPE